jgi:predicted subunit of tRNA(5-methylaminomethyl-2-thiouridylate) methyltransferase
VTDDHDHALAQAAGLGFDAVADDALVDAHLAVTVGPSEEIPRADYEAELRALRREQRGDETVADVFPAHDQTNVEGIRE